MNKYDELLSEIWAFPKCNKQKHDFQVWIEDFTTVILCCHCNFCAYMTTEMYQAFNQEEPPNATNRQHST